MCTPSGKNESRKLDLIQKRFVRKYLLEAERRDLFNRGVALSVGHSRTNRTW